MRAHHARMGLAMATVLAVTACGGGGGTNVASTPPPPVGPTPTPTPTPTPPPPIAPAHLGLVSSEPFAVLGTSVRGTTDTEGTNPVPLSGPTFDDVQFSYDGSTNTYEISLPGFQPGELGNTSYNGTSGQPATGSVSQVAVGSSSTFQPVFVSLPVPGTSYSPYTYTSFGEWTGQTGTTGNDQTGRVEGIFAYGIPTAAGDVPVTGSATYSAEIRATYGFQSYPSVGGDATLSFNFAAGTLSGFMHPEVADSFDGIFIDFGRYDFTQTVYSTGSTSFSGKFIVPGLPNADSSFEGNFTGPNAAELMARFEAPFLVDGQQGTLSGAWVGKKN